ncbi:MAG TPA: CHRD domain-containing protein [Steroidobacteraceae bacterium]
MRHILALKRARAAVTLLVAGALALILAACGGGYGGSSGSGSGPMGCGGAYGNPCPAPSINLASPGATVDRTVKLSASANTTGSASVKQVDFMIDGTIVGTATAPPFTVNWDSTSVGDGNHALTAKVTDSQGQSATAPAVTIKVDNNPAFSVTMAPAQIFPAPSSSASGTANLTVKLASGATSGKVTLSGVTATAVTINEALAGATGAGVITLAANGGTAGEWDVPAGALLTADQVTALLQGKLYVIATSAASPGGEIRGQITPANVTVNFSNLAGSQEVPAVTISAAGVAATTVDSIANTLSVHVNSTGVDDATTAEVDTGAAGATGARLAALTKDSVHMGHWSTELATITASDVGNFNANKWYVNVVTPADPQGAIRGQINASSTPPAAPTLTQLKSSAFSVCGGCHTGGGSSLPASMDLTPSHIYASIVNVASVEQSALKRVKPGDPDNSYVVQKLQGSAGITGGRMPLGGPYLDQATIDQVRAWISAGAQNN